MRGHINNLLGKYTLLQYDISTQSDERQRTQSIKRSFFARFARHDNPVIDTYRDDRPRINKASEMQRLERLTKGSSSNLFVAKTLWPFVLFPDTIKIDRQKITIVHNDFLWQSKTVSTEIKNIMNVEADMGPLFGSITITSKHFLNNTQTIKCLKRRDVIMAQRLLQGFMIAQRAAINTEDIRTEQLLALLNDLGQENHR